MIASIYGLLWVNFYYVLGALFPLFWLYAIFLILSFFVKYD